MYTCATCKHRKCCIGAEEDRWCGNYKEHDELSVL